MPVSDTLITQILREYDEKRLTAQAQARDRKAQVYARLPRLQAIDQELESFGLHAVRTYLQNGKNKELVLSSLKQHNQQLLSEKQRLLMAAGYPADYLEVHYQCPLCQDTGYVDGKKCRCLKQRLIDLAYERSNLKSVLQRENFSTFNLNLFSSEPVPGEKGSPRENIQATRDKVFSYIQNFPVSQPSNLFFYGPSGTGKTFFCNCIAKALLDKGYTVLYMTASELFSAFEAYRFRDKNRTASSVNVQEIIHDTDLLIIDDLGTEFTTVLSSSDLFNCLNQRMLRQKATIISSNLDLSQIQRVYTDRVASRIAGGYQLIKLYGPDLRRY